MNFSFMSDGFRFDYWRSKGTTFHVDDFLRNEFKSWRSSKLAGKLTELQDFHQGQAAKFISATKFSVVLNFSCVGLIEINHLSFSKVRIKNDRLLRVFLVTPVDHQNWVKSRPSCELNKRIQASIRISF